MRRRVAFACVFALGAIAVAQASIAFDPPSGTTSARGGVRVKMTSSNAPAEEIFYTLDESAPAIGGETTKRYTEDGVDLPCVIVDRRARWIEGCEGDEEGNCVRIATARDAAFERARLTTTRDDAWTHRRIGTWIVKAAPRVNGSLGDVSVASYEVRRRGESDGAPLTLGSALGVALLLVMGLFGFVVFAGVCTAGFNALFGKTAPTMRGPGVSDPRTSTESSAELGQLPSGFRNNPAVASADDAGTSRLITRSSSLSNLTPTRLGKKD